MPDTIIKKSFIGAFYNVIVSAITLILGLIRTIALMRLLGVESYGTISLALVFSRLVLPFSSLGLDHALLQKTTPSEDAYSTHFVLRIGFSFLAGLICLGVSPFLRFEFDDLLVDIFLILLVINLIDSTYATHFVILRREMRFGSLAAINLFSSIIMTILTPLAAYLGAGVWSLVLEQTLGSITRWGSAWFIIRPHKLSLKISGTEVRSQISFGIQITAGNLLGTVLDRFDDFWTGTTLGPIALGYYSRAYELTQYPERALSAPITSVFLPAYASLRSDRQELSRLFSRASYFLMRAGFLISACMVLTAPELVTLLFTSRWLPIVPIFRLMTIYILLDPIYINLSALLIGVGHPGLLNRVRVIQAGFFTLLVILLADFWGTIGVALAADIMMLTGVALLLGFSRRFIKYSFPHIWLIPSVATLFACTAGYYLPSLLPVNNSALLLALKIGFVLITYVVTLIIFEYKDLRQNAFSFVKSILEGLKLGTSNQEDM